MPGETEQATGQAGEAAKEPGTQAAAQGGQPGDTTPATYTEDQVKQLLAKLQEQHQAQLSKTQGSLGSRIQTLQGTLDKIAEWKGLDEEKQSAMLDRAQVALDHAEALADRYGLTEKQKALVARHGTAQDRREAAEAIMEGRKPSAPPGDKGSLAAMLQELGIEVPGIGSKGSQPIAPRGGAAVSDPFQRLAAAVNSPGRLDPALIAEINKRL